MSSTAYTRVISHTVVTAENIDEVRQAVSGDQGDKLVVGAETWGILYDGGQRGQMSRWPDDRGAIATGGDSAWGDWVPTTPDDGEGNVVLPDMLRTDDGHYYSEYGEPLCRHGYALGADEFRGCDCEPEVNE